MSGRVQAGEISGVAAAASGPYLRVKLNVSGKLALAGANDVEIGTLTGRVLKADDPAAVLPMNLEGTRKFVVAGAVAKEALLYRAASGKVNDVVNGPPIAIALEAGSGDGSIIEGLPIANLDFLDVSFVIGAEAADAIVVSLQVKDAFGNDVIKRVPLKVFLFDDANGDAFNTDDYTIAAGTDGALAESVADKVLECITEDDGDLDISLTIVGAATTYMGVQLPGRSDLVFSGAITHAA